MAALEVEQKFVFQMKEIAKKLASYNATFLGSKTFRDTYYDFPDKKLALRNIWLRQRQSTWELKTGNIPKVNPVDFEGLGTTYYVEREGKDQISQELDRHPFFKAYPTFDSKLRCLQPLAIVETTRTSYRLNDHTKIDLDNARLIPTEDLARRDITNYSIGEIEIMVYEKDALGTSHSEKLEREFQKVRELLGIETSDRLLSKLDRYFEEYLPEFYKTYPYHS